MTENSKKQQIVLNVDDETNVTGLVSKLFERKGVRVETANTFKDATRAILGRDGYSGIKKYDGLILDINLKSPKSNMHHYNGIELAVIAINLGYSGPIIMFSGLADSEENEETMIKKNGKRKPTNTSYLNKSTINALYNLYESLRVKD